MMRLLAILSLVLSTCVAVASDGAWLDTFRAMPVQDGGRVMPLDSYANRLAIELTGRSRWSEDRGSEAFSGTAWA